MKVTFTEELFVQFCPACTVRFAYPESLRQNRAQTAGDIYCPNGHRLSYAENDADRFRRERDRLAQRVAEKDDEIARQRQFREDAERSATALRGQIIKLKKRTANGVCPCCTRSFVNLKRHIATKHPSFGADETNVIPLKAGA